eukprot:scaffold221556_cov19-Prasinocladus_malaysianus.AAC.1
MTCLAFRPPKGSIAKHVKQIQAPIASQAATKDKTSNWHVAIMLSFPTLHHNAVLTEKRHVVQI